jgi:hypothetical protein
MDQRSDQADSWSNIYLQRRSRIIQHRGYWGVSDPSSPILCLQPSLGKAGTYFSFEASQQEQKSLTPPALSIYKFTQGFFGRTSLEILSSCCLWGLQLNILRSSGDNSPVHLHNSVSYHQLGFTGLQQELGRPLNKYCLVPKLVQNSHGDPELVFTATSAFLSEKSLSLYSN